MMRSKLLNGCILGLLILVTSISAGAVTWPLRISANGNYLEDQAGVPFLIVGEAAWSMAAQLNPADVIVYLNDRQAKGYTAIIVNAIEHQFASNAPRNYNNQHPFVGGDANWSVRNETYWSHLDFILNEAKNRNILVFLFPAYIGFQCGDQGWCAEMLGQAEAQMAGYGEWLGARYANQGNIVWVHGGDANANSYAGAMSRVAAIANGIKSKDSNHLHTAHSAPERSALDDYASLIDLNTTYSYSDPQGEIQRDYQRVSALPFTFIESSYENEHSSTAFDWQRQALTAYLGGALLGHFFGNCPIWHFGGDPSWCGLSDWETQLGSVGSTSMANIGKLMKSRDWWKFEPDYQNSVVTTGKGSGANYKATARAFDGRTAMVWFPNASQAVVDLSKISGQQAKVYWWSPNDNSSTLIGTYANTGLQTFNSSSDGMVLVIDDQDAGFAAPGQLSATNGGDGGGGGGGNSSSGGGGGGGGCFIHSVTRTQQ